jgi:hypothetical protein
MPRDGSGNYTLPAGNPFVTGTTISSTTMNNTLTDIATALTGSLSRSGQGGMLVAFQNLSGISASPGITWSSDTASGFYLPSAGEMRATMGATIVSRWTAANFFQWSQDNGSTWKSPLPTVAPVVSSGGLTVSAGGANITGGLTVDGAAFQTGAVPSVSGNAGKFLRTDGSTTVWTAANTATVGSQATNNTTTVGSWVDTGATATITTTGGPLYCFTGGDDAGLTTGSLYSSVLGSSVAVAGFSVDNGSTFFGYTRLMANTDPAGRTLVGLKPSLSAGSYTIKVFVKLIGGSGTTVQWNTLTIRGYEIR